MNASRLPASNTKAAAGPLVAMFATAGRREGNSCKADRGIGGRFIRTGAALIAALSNAGFSVVRIKGSHHFLGHEDGRSTVVPVHSGETIGPGLIHKLLRDCHLSVEDLQELL